MTIEKAGKTMNEQIKNEIISKIERIEETQKEEKSFTVTDCRGHKVKHDLLLVNMQTEDGQTVRECFSLISPARLIDVLKACSIYRPDMTARAPSLQNERKDHERNTRRETGTDPEKSTGRHDAGRYGKTAGRTDPGTFCH